MLLKGTDREYYLQERNNMFGIQNLENLGFQRPS